MATLKILLRNDSESANIYVRYSLGRRKILWRKTGFITNAKFWDEAKDRTKLKDENSKKLNKDLRELKVYLENAYNDAIGSGIETTGEWLQLQIDIFNNKLPVVELDILTNYIQKYIDEAPYKLNAKKEMGLSEGRIRNIKLFKNTILKYEAETLKGKSILVKEVDLKFLDTYKMWMFNKGYSINYVGKNVANFKTICRDAFKNDIETSSQIKSFSVIHEYKKAETIIILTEDEQEEIKNAPLLRESLINARKWLLLGCLIGQRAGDLLNITEKNIKKINEVKIIELKQQKTGKLIVIPLFPRAIEIIENGFPYKISLALFNEYIKDVCEAAELNTLTTARIKIKRGLPDKIVTEPKYKVISSHVCRRSFASNLYGKIPTPNLIGITGHGTEAMFLRYIGKTSYDNALSTLEYFNKLAPKQKDTHTMEIIRNTAEK